MQGNNNDQSTLNKIFNARMTEADFQKLSSFIYNNYGIKMPPEKRIMLQSRLQKRLRELNITTYKEYIDYLFSKDGMQNELYHMIDMVSTNKTDFFREPSHFEILIQKVLPNLINEKIISGVIKVWSSASSSGEEPYTLAMVLNEFKNINPKYDFSIYATDISTRMLQKGITAVYPEERVDVIPMNLKRKYLLKSKDITKRTVRIIPALRTKVTFRRLNLMDASYGINEMFDIVFCRNVLIYFDRETQEKVISKICKNLKSGGYFFLGHSESIMNMNVPLKQVSPTVFKKL